MMIQPQRPQQQPQQHHHQHNHHHVVQTLAHLLIIPLQCMVEQHPPPPLQHTHQQVQWVVVLIHQHHLCIRHTKSLLNTHINASNKINRIYGLTLLILAKIWLTTIILPKDNLGTFFRERSGLELLSFLKNNPWKKTDEETLFQL